MSEKSECARCWQPLTPETTVDLWDGKSYCRECVERACTGLADYARARDELWAQQYRMHREWGIWMWFGLCFVPLPLIGLIMSWLSGFGFGFLLVLMPLVTIYFSFAVAFLGTSYFDSRRPMRVTIRNGVVKLAKTSKADRLVDLCQCTWQTVAQSSWPMTRIFAMSPGIALWTPTRFLGLRACRDFALTDEEERFWAGFLTLAGIPNRNPFQFWKKKRASENS